MQKLKQFHNSSSSHYELIFVMNMFAYILLMPSIMPSLIIRLFIVLGVHCMGIPAEFSQTFLFISMCLACWICRNYRVTCLEIFLPRALVKLKWFSSQPELFSTPKIKYQFHWLSRVFKIFDGQHYRCFNCTWAFFIYQIHNEFNAILGSIYRDFKLHWKNCRKKICIIKTAREKKSRLIEFKIMLNYWN